MDQVLPPATRNGSGYERTGVRQFTIFLENRVGKLTRLLREVESDGRTVNALNVEESADAALVRLICSSPDATRHTLRHAGFSFSETDVLAVRLPQNDECPILAITTALLAAEINIHYAYSLLRTPKGPAVALYVDDPTLAAQLLIRKGFRLIGETDLNPDHPDIGETDPDPHDSDE